MSENSSSEWDQLIGEWRPIWDEWNEVMKRLTLAFSTSGLPSDDDLELAHRLNEQVKVIQAKMDEFISNLIGRQ